MSKCEQEPQETCWALNITTDVFKMLSAVEMNRFIAPAASQCGGHVCMSFQEVGDQEEADAH